MIRCPHCMSPLDKVVERPLVSALSEKVQLLGVTFIAERPVAKVMGECPQHGVVTTVRKERL